MRSFTGTLAAILFVAQLLSPPRNLIPKNWIADYHEIKSVTRLLFYPYLESQVTQPPAKRMLEEDGLCSSSTLGRLR